MMEMSKLAKITHKSKTFHVKNMAKIRGCLIIKNCEISRRAKSCMFIEEYFVT